MAKKSSARRREQSAQSLFDDSKYENVRVAATFEYNELSLSRAAEQLAPRLKSSMVFVNLASLLALVAAAILVPDLSALLIGLFVVAVVMMYVQHNWNKLAVRYARTTTLAPSAYEGSIHVVACDDALHLEDAHGVDARFDYADLRVVYPTSEFVVAGFGKKRYVYVPRSALSEGRFRELVRILDAHCK